MKVIHLIKIVLIVFLTANVFAQDDGFIQNNGQFFDQDRNPVPNLRFMGVRNGLSVQLFEDHFSYEIKNQEKLEKKVRKGEFSDWDLPKNFTIDYSRIEFHFGSNCKRLIPNKKLSAYNNYYFPHGKFFEVPSYENVNYIDVFPNIDLEFQLTEQNLKYNFVLKTGAKIEDIELEIRGGDEVYLKNGELIIETKNGTIRENIPFSFVRSGSKEGEEIDVNYELTGRNLKFVTEPSFDPDLELVIDPVPSLEWALYTGGPDNEYIEAVEVDTMNRIITTGFSASLTMIATSGAYDETMDGVFDVSLLCHDDLGTKIWGTYWGGSAYDRAYGLDISETNDIFLTGNTFSAGMAEPLGGVHQDFQVNGDEAFIARFDADGFKTWSTYYGGDAHDFGAAIAVDNQNNSYISGHTFSTTNIAYAGSSAPYKAFFSGGSNAFIFKCTADGNTGWGTYFGEVAEEGWGIGLDSAANVYISGYCQATFGIATPGTHQFSLGGFIDVFLTKFDSAGVQDWGTYYGGTGADQSYGLTVAPDGHTYVAGLTESTTNIWYGGAYQSTAGSFSDSFCAKFRPNGTVVWGTYVGGTGADYIYGVDLGKDSNVVVGGMTLSSDQIALPDAFDDSWETLYDACFISIDSSGDYRFGTYYGAAGHDEARDIAVSDRDLFVYLTGRTESTSGMSTSNVYPGGTGDTFLAKFCNPVLINIEVTNSTSVCEGEPDTLYITEPSAFTSVTWNTAETTDEIYIAGLTTGSYQYYANGVDTNGCATRSDTITINYFETETYPVYHTPNGTCGSDTITIWTDSTDNTVGFEWMTGGTDSLDLWTGIVGVDSAAYWVIVTDTNGCQMSSDTGWAQIWPTPDPTITITTTPPFCENQAIDLSVALADTILWDNGDDTSTTTYSWPDPGDYEVTVITTSDSSCVTYDTITVTIANCLSVAELALESVVYPNPVIDILSVQVDRALQLELYDPLGKLILIEQLQTDKIKKIDMSYLAAGVYTLGFRNGDSYHSRKIVKIE